MAGSRAGEIRESRGFIAGTRLERERVDRDTALEGSAPVRRSIEGSHAPIVGQWLISVS